MARDHKIKRYRKNDMALLESVARYGHATLSDFQNLKISSRRAKDFCRKSCGLLETFPCRQNGKSEIAYRLTRKGQRFARDRLNISHPARSNQMTFPHNEKLKAVIQNMDQQGNKKIIRYHTENELKHTHKTLIRSRRTFEPIGVADCMLEFDDGSQLLIEIVTSNYTQEILSGKQHFAEALGLPIQYHQAF